MVTEIIFEVYVFIANKYNYMKNNCIPSISVLYEYFLNELLCLVLFVILEQLSMHWFLNLFLFLLTFLVLWTHMYVYASSESYWHRLWAYIHMRSAKVTSMDYDTHIYMRLSIFLILNVV